MERIKLGTVTVSGSGAVRDYASGQERLEVWLTRYPDPSGETAYVSLVYRTALLPTPEGAIELELSLRSARALAALLTQPNTPT